MKVGVVKFDCLYTEDDILYEKMGVPVKKVCPVLYVLITSLSVILKKLFNGEETRFGSSYHGKCRTMQSLFPLYQGN